MILTCDLEKVCTSLNYNGNKLSFSLMQRDIQDLFSTKLSITDFHSALAKKADKSTVQSQLAEKADAGMSQSFNQRKRSFESIVVDMKSILGRIFFC